MNKRSLDADKRRLTQINILELKTVGEREKREGKGEIMIEDIRPKAEDPRPKT